MKKIVFFVIVVLSAVLCAQAPQWKKTGYVPSPASRINDATFLSTQLGWVVNGVGQIHRTTNGGVSWVRQFEKSNTHFRSVVFFDSLNGFAGALGFGDPNNTASTDSNILYKTSNGGNSWLPVVQLSSAIIKRGFCGVQKINDSTAVAVGRVRGPAWFYKTTDRGNNWSATDLSSVAAGLIDVYFFTPDSGIVVGLTNTNHDSSSAIILSTRNGGATWSPLYKTTRKGEWAWKIFFPTRMTGYISLQRNTLAPIYILKTTDGGFTWNEKLFFQTNYFVQGIGFSDENTGWVGGNTSYSMYQTTDGGDSWRPLGIGRRINRFRMLSPQFGFAVGDSVYQYSAVTGTEKEKEKDRTGTMVLYNTYPNPARGTTTVSLSVTGKEFVSLQIFSVNGELIQTIIARELEPGNHSFQWDGENEAGEPMPSGEYIVRMLAGVKSEAKKISLIR